MSRQHCIDLLEGHKVNATRHLYSLKQSQISYQEPYEKWGVPERCILWLTNAGTYRNLDVTLEYDLQGNLMDIDAEIMTNAPQRRLGDTRKDISKIAGCRVREIHSHTERLERGRFYPENHVHINCRPGNLRYILRGLEAAADNAEVLP